MSSKLFLDESVKSFFGRLNWDNLSLQQPTGPMEFVPVRDFFASIPWNGDPGALAARSLASATAQEAEWEDEESSLTLSDLFGMF